MPHYYCKSQEKYELPGKKNTKEEKYIVTSPNSSLSLLLSMQVFFKEFFKGGSKFGGSYAHLWLARSHILVIVLRTNLKRGGD